MLTQSAYFVVAHLAVARRIVGSLMRDSAVYQADPDKSSYLLVREGQVTLGSDAAEASAEVD